MTREEALKIVRSAFETIARSRSGGYDKLEEETNLNFMDFLFNSLDMTELSVELKRRRFDVPPERLLNKNAVQKVGDIVSLVVEFAPR